MLSKDGDVNANFKLVVFTTIILVKASPLQEKDGHSHQDNETDFTSLKFAFTDGEENCFRFAALVTLMVGYRSLQAISQRRYRDERHHQ